MFHKTFKWILIGLFGLAFSVSVGAQVVTRGPYLQIWTPNSVLVRWRTDIPTDSRVVFGSSPNNLTNQVGDSTITTEHEIQLANLSPQTTYHYGIGTSSQILAGNDTNHFFVTSPSVGSSNPVRIWVLGDSGTANSDAAAVRDAYFGFNGDAYTQAWLMLGDNAYFNGTDSEYQSAVFDMYPSILRQTVLWPTLGNHDGQSANSDTETGPYYDIFTLPRLAEAGGLASGTEAYYSFDIANIHFICLNSHDGDSDPSGPMLTWLQNDLATTMQKWIIAYWHHPPYSKGSHDSDIEGELIAMRENALPILESYGADLVLAGHSHTYERSFLLHGHYQDSITFDSATMIVNDGDGRADGDGEYLKNPTGTVYVVSGSSGKVTLGTPLDHPVMFLSMEELGSLVLDVDGNRLDARFINDAGAIVDNLTLRKGNKAPAVNAGFDQAVILPASSLLDGTVSDDDLPDPPAAVNTLWTMINGPGTVTLTDATAVDTDVSFSTDGIYVLQLESTDGEFTTTDEIIVTVYPAETINQAPSVTAGGTQTVTLPGSVSLDGTVTDDGLPDPSGTVTTTWIQISGPGIVAFTDGSTVDTTASFSADGTCVLRLTANDGEFVVDDEVALIVNPAPLPPRLQLLNSWIFAWFRVRMMLKNNHQELRG